jgi:hypothetical protein
MVQYLSELWPFNYFNFQTIPLIPLLQFQGNITGLIGRSNTCAYYTGFLLEWFLAQLWPLNEKVMKMLIKFVRTSPHVPLMQCQWNLCIIHAFFAWIILGWFIVIEWKIVPATQKFVWTTTLKLLAGVISSNHYGIINTMSGCASHQHYSVHWFLSEFLPFHFNFEVCPDNSYYII